MLDHFIRPHRELCKDPERISNPPVSLNEMSFWTKRVASSRYDMGLAVCGCLNRSVSY
jgi:hypothetical protein